MSKPINTSRRRILKAGALAVAAIPLSTVVHQSQVKAMPKAEDGHAHDYVSDASEAADHAEYEEGQNCENCAFWAGDAKNDWGSCHHPDFAGVAVNRNGWCSQWVG